jgi:hypothetical protein
MMKRVIAVGGAVLLLAAFLVGYWPQHRQAATLETEVSTLRDRVADLEARNRAAALLGDLLNLRDTVARRDYGQAQQLSSAFFDHVRAEAASTVPSLKAGLASMLNSRDAVTSALARGDERVTEQLQQIELQLRALLGYPTGPAQKS